MVVKLDVQKTTANIFWTNRYLLDFATIGEVTLAMITDIVNGEKAVHSPSVQFVSARVSDMIEGTDNFIVYPWTGTGAAAGTGGNVPGYCTLRLDAGVGVGRPCRKYYRVYVATSATDGPNWQASYRNSCATALATMMSQVPALCDPQGNHWVNTAVKLQIQMRQIRRGSRRRETPVIPIS